MDNLISYLEYNLSEFTQSEQIIARFFLSKKDLENTGIVEVSERLFVSTATISRFVNKIGFENYKSFLYEFQKSLESNKSDGIAINSEARDLWNVHNTYYKSLYESVATIDLNYLANRFINSKMIYTFGFGKTQETTNMMIYRIENLIQNIRSIPHFEHLMYTLTNVMSYEHVLVIFYQHEYFRDDLEKIIMIAKQRFVPIIVVTLSAQVDNQNYAEVIKLYPHEDDTVVKYSTTMYTPYLLFIDMMYLAIQRKKNQQQFNYV